MEISAEQLLPLVLDFAEQYLTEDDFETLKSSFKSDVDYKKDILVKNGGLKAILKVYLK